MADSLEETKRYIAEYEARERALRDWTARSQDTPLGRVAALILAEDDEAANLSGGQGPEYYSGLAFALGAITDEVLGDG
jgi:hypothetical protein